MRTKRTEYKHVLLWPDGTPTVSGTRLKVKHLAALHRYNAKGPEELVDAFPPHTLAEMYSALAYYYDHKADMDQQMDEDERDFEEARIAAAEASPVVEKLRSLDRVL
jgi:uncharacterized protein (DUF433 family)